MIKKNKKSIYGFLILLIFLSTTFSFQQIFIHLNSLNHEISPNFPLSSANEITLITPENKTYFEPMNGYYPGTFSFENELDGTSRTSIAYVDGTNAIHSNCEVEITNNYQGHNKVLRVHDGNTAGNAGAEHYFDPIQTTGTTEWWWLIPAAGDSRMWVHFHQDQIGTVAFSLGAIDGTFRQNNGNTVQAYNNNQWYHHKVSFDTNSDMYDWYIDGIMVVNGGAFQNLVSNIGSTHIKGAWTTTGESYFDAFGYSWDTTYNIGDNLNEGLLITYSNSTNLDWIGYSLDGLVNKTILGNATIPMPVNGVHSIQVFGNDSLGTMYESDLRYFTADIGEISIITPENKTYTEPMGGYFPATYGFEAYNSGEIPDSWNDLSGTGCSAGVVDEINNHKKVIQLNDNSGNGATIETLFPNRKTGIVEWWWLSTDVNNWVNFVFYEGGTNAIHLEIGISAFRYYDTSYKTVVSSGVNNNQWYRNKVEFSVSTDTFNWYIYDNNGSLLNSVQDANFRNSVDDINHLTTGTNSAQLGYQTYIDAVSFSWDSNYNIGDNLNEGLLLSYDTSTNLNWTAYSLDGNPNITIAGNKVIPFPEVGFHSIILNGITSNGTLIMSDIRYFTIFIIIQDPPIPPNNPNLIPIILTIIGIGIIALLGITLFLFRRKISSRTSSTIISRKKSQSNENVDSGSDQFKTCPLCHTQIKKTNQFCEYCGTSLKNN